jgi:hypothetical protein
MSQQASASPSLEIESSQLVKVIVGPTAHCQPFILSRRALEFYSPYLRTLTEKAGASSTISLHGDTPAPFEVLVAWMNLDAAPSPCHQRGVALDKLIEVEDDEGVRLAYRVWVLAHRLGGPCLVLGDQCMRYLYKEYVMPIPGSSGLVVNPATAFLVAKHARDSRKLERFVLACLTLDGLRSTAAQTAAGTSAGVQSSLGGTIEQVARAAIEGVVGVGGVHVCAGRRDAGLVPRTGCGRGFRIGITRRARTQVV